MADRMSPPVMTTAPMAGNMMMTATMTVADGSMVTRACPARALIPPPHRGGQGEKDGHGKTDGCGDSSHSFSSFIVAVRWWRTVSLTFVEVPMRGTAARHVVRPPGVGSAAGAGRSPRL
jgi:hypothetical protein